MQHGIGMAGLDRVATEAIWLACLMRPGPSLNEALGVVAGGTPLAQCRLSPARGMEGVHPSHRGHNIAPAMLIPLEDPGLRLRKRPRTGSHVAM